MFYRPIPLLRSIHAECVHIVKFQHMYTCAIGQSPRLLRYSLKNTNRKCRLYELNSSGVFMRMEFMRIEWHSFYFMVMGMSYSWSSCEFGIPDIYRMTHMGQRWEISKGKRMSLYYMIGPCHSNRELIPRISFLYPSSIICEVIINDYLTFLNQLTSIQRIYIRCCQRLTEMLCYIPFRLYTEI